MSVDDEPKRANVDHAVESRHMKTYLYLPETETCLLYLPWLITRNVFQTLINVNDYRLHSKYEDWFHMLESQSLF